jgi:hypothetical protein
MSGNLANITVNSTTHQLRYSLPQFTGTNYISGDVTNNLSIAQISNNNYISHDNVDKMNANSQEMSSFSIIKNRANTFKSFMAAVDQQRFSSNEAGVVKLFDERDSLDSKKRAKFWASRLLEPTSIFIRKLLYMRSDEIKESRLNWKDVNANFIVIPIGVDVWGTMGGVNQSSEYVDWNKCLLYFVPSSQILDAIGDYDVSACFTLAESIELPRQSIGVESTVTRNIEL